MIIITITLFTYNETYAQIEYKEVTCVESVVPNGVGRSRIIRGNESKNYKAFTSTQTEEDNTRNKSDRGALRVKDNEETKLLNFFNIGGIRLQIIAVNDTVISSKINDMIASKQELAFATSAIESNASKSDGNGILITRYIFKKNN